MWQHIHNYSATILPCSFLLQLFCHAGAVHTPPHIPWPGSVSGSGSGLGSWSLSGFWSWSGSGSGSWPGSGSLCVCVSLHKGKSLFRCHRFLRGEAATEVTHFCDVLCVPTHVGDSLLCVPLCVPLWLLPHSLHPTHTFYVLHMHKLCAPLGKAVMELSTFTDFLHIAHRSPMDSCVSMHYFALALH